MGSIRQLVRVHLEEDLADEAVLDVERPHVEEAGVDQRDLGSGELPGLRLQQMFSQMQTRSQYQWAQPP